MGWGGPGINRLDSGPPGGPSRQPPSHPCLPTLEGGPWREKAALGPRAELPPSHQSNLPAGQGPALSSFNTDSHKGPEPLSSSTEAPQSGWGWGWGWGRSRRSKCKGSRCWSLSFICGDGEREELEVGACLGTPRALCGVSWVGQETQRLGLGPKGGCWVALRDLGSQLGSPSTLGSLASNCKANLFGAGTGGRSPVGGEVTGIRCGRPRLLKPGIGQLPLPALVSTLPWSTEGQAFTPAPPRPTPGRGPGGPEPAEGSQLNLSAGRGGRRRAAGGREPGEDFSSRQLGGAGSRG